MMGPLDRFKLAAAFVAGLAVGCCTVGAYGVFVALPAAREYGRKAESLANAERQIEATQAAAADRAARQTKINAIEADYARRTAEQEARLVSLEQALQEKPDDAPPAGGAACRVLVPRRVSNELDRIGRAPATPAASHPAQPDAALPARR
ncbi:hypothetical protein [Aureimonas sp. N4]|uniref:hypothetical protein n=1 Tax=Aureimonas sp. N4 TaxID=1638165 RepID=UPI000AD1871D|nr:hypothetical protein [Aureimonas sp. N4]